MDMAGFGIVNLIVVIVLLIVVLVPVIKILHRTGHSGWWVLLWFVPIVNLIALWIFAYGRWPAVEKA